MKKILNITGVIGLIPDESGEMITPNTTFIDVVTAIESASGVSEVEVFINSPGGLVEEADMIFDYLTNLKKSGVVVNTVAEAECASAAVKIFLSGSQRVVHEHTQFMIHNPFAQSPEGDADVIEGFGKALRSIENDMIAFYSKHTGTSKEALKPLMKQETTLTPDQCVSLGFATRIDRVVDQIPLKAVAFSKRINQNLNTSKMAKDALDKKGIEDLFDSLLNTVKNFGKKQKKKGLKIVLDAEAGEIEFPEIEEGDVPSVGDKTTAEDGEYLLPSGETYVITSGELTEIKPAEEEEGDDPAEMLEKANARIAELESQLQEFKNLQKENADLKEETKQMKEEVKNLAKGLNTLKKSIGSGFDHNGKAKNHKKEGEEKARSLFKQDEE